MMRKREPLLSRKTFGRPRPDESVVVLLKYQYIRLNCRRKMVWLYFVITDGHRFVNVITNSANLPLETRILLQCGLL